MRGVYSGLESAPDSDSACGCSVTGAAPAPTPADTATTVTAAGSDTATTVTAAGSVTAAAFNSCSHLAHLMKITGSLAAAISATPKPTSTSGEDNAGNAISNVPLGALSASAASAVKAKKAKGYEMALRQLLSAMVSKKYNNLFPHISVDGV